MNKYLKYSSMAFQMGATIGIFAFIGYKLDQHFQIRDSYCTIGLALLGVGISLFTVIRDFIKPEK
jgi:F0F1-type ATP synthase assembly protein I